MSKVSMIGRSSQQLQIDHLIDDIFRDESTLSPVEDNNEGPKRADKIGKEVALSLLENAKDPSLVRKKIYLPDGLRSQSDTTEKDFHEYLRAIQETQNPTIDSLRDFERRFGQDPQTFSLRLVQEIDDDATILEMVNDAFNRKDYLLVLEKTDELFSLFFNFEQIPDRFNRTFAIRSKTIEILVKKKQKEPLMSRCCSLGAAGKQWLAKEYYELIEKNWRSERVTLFIRFGDSLIQCAKSSPSIMQKFSALKGALKEFTAASVVKPGDANLVAKIAFCKQEIGLAGNEGRIQREYLSIPDVGNSPKLEELVGRTVQTNEIEAPPVPARGDLAIKDCPFKELTGKIDSLEATCSSISMSSIVHVCKTIAQIEEDINNYLKTNVFSPDLQKLSLKFDSLKERVVSSLPKVANKIREQIHSLTTQNWMTLGSELRNVIEELKKAFPSDCLHLNLEVELFVYIATIESNNMRSIVFFNLATEIMKQEEHEVEDQLLDKFHALKIRFKLYTGAI